MNLTTGLLWFGAIIGLGSIGLTCFAMWLKNRENEESAHCDHIDHKPA